MNVRAHVAQRLFRLLPVLALLSAFGVSACYEDYGLTTQDFDTYFTHFAEGTNFQNFKYFVMPDTVVHIYDTTKVDPLLASRKFDKQILSLTASNMEARGYERKTLAELTSQGIDSSKVLVVLVGQLSREYTGYYYTYWYGYWGWYWPGYYPGYYPPAYGGTYEYEMGTNITEIVDLGTTRKEKRPTPVWTGIVSGLAGQPSTAQSRISTGINRTFEQSPYLYSGQ
jgi:hypothetical protein